MSSQSQNMQCESCLNLGLFVLASGLEICWKNLPRLSAFPMLLELAGTKSCSSRFCTLLVCRQTPDVVREQFIEILISSCVTVPYINAEEIPLILKNQHEEY